MTFAINFLIILTVLMNTAAQIMLKAGIMRVGEFSFTWDNLIPITAKVLLMPWIIIALVVYALSVFTWLMVLSRVPVSIAYPLSSLGYVTSAVAAYYFYGEDLTLTRIIGIFVILIGVYLVAKN
jgi:multidrug transporter EmrE-like cation transporter